MSLARAARAAGYRPHTVSQGRAGQAVRRPAESPSGEPPAHPGVGLRHQLSHIRGQFTLDHVLDRDVFQHGTQAGPDGHPGFLQVLRGALVRRRLRP